MRSAKTVGAYRSGNAQQMLIVRQVRCAPMDNAHLPMNATITDRVQPERCAYRVDVNRIRSAE